MILILATLLSNPGCGAKPTWQAAEVQQIKVHSGRRFKVVLDCNKEDGTAWKLVKRLDIENVLFVDSERIIDPMPSDSSNAYDVWTFMAQNPGHTDIVLKSTRKTHIFSLDVVD
jgi:predicted secreted protein